MVASKKNVDFTNVKEGSSVNPKRQPAGDYLGKVIEVKDSPAKDGTFQWLFVVKAGSGTYPYYCKFQDNQFWKLRNLLVAAGKNVPKRRVSVDPNSIVGKDVGITLEDDEYNDKLKSSIGAVFPPSDLDPEIAGEGDEDDEYDEEEEEEEPTPPARKKRRAPEPEPEEDEDEDEEEEEEEGDEDEEEEEPEPTPPPRRRAKKAAPARRKATAAVTDDELEELDIDSV